MVKFFHCKEMVALLQSYYASAIAVKCFRILIGFSRLAPFFGFINVYFIHFQHDFVDWDFTHNVRNFSLSETDGGESGCIWECRENHLGSIFALTRRLLPGNILTCTCGFSQAFNLNKMVSPEFCQAKNLDYYNVNCVTDLDEDGGHHGWVSRQGFKG